MSFKQLAETERKLLTDQKPIRWWVLVVLWVCGAVSGAVYVSGCNLAIQGANGLGKDMQVAGAGIQAMTHKQRDIGANSFQAPKDSGVDGMGFIDSMQLDKEGF